MIFLRTKHEENKENQNQKNNEFDKKNIHNDLHCHARYGHQRTSQPLEMMCAMWHTYGGSEVLNGAIWFWATYTISNKITNNSHPISRCNGNKYIKYEMYLNIFMPPIH